MANDKRANGYVVTTFKSALGRFTPRGNKVYATPEEALAVASRLGDVNGYWAYVDWASPYGLGLEAA
jgi:hypothetical protein